MIWQLLTAAQSSTVSAAPSLPTSLLDSTRPVSASRMYSVVPATTLERLLPCCCEYGRNPEPTITMNLPLAFTASPTAGSDHARPTGFSRAFGPLAMSRDGAAVVEIVESNIDIRGKLHFNWTRLLSAK